MFVVLAAVCLTACGGQRTDNVLAGTAGDGMVAEPDAECGDRYMELLGDYLKEQLDLERYDREVGELGCLPLDAGKQSEAQKRGNMRLTYLYLRNELHLEQLSSDDLGILKKSIGKDAGEERDRAFEVVVRTFPECTRPVPAQDEEEKIFPMCTIISLARRTGRRT